MNVREQTEGSALAGTQLGRYRLGARIGAGGAASVYLALLRGPDGFERVLAVKVVHPHLVGSARFVNLFVDEASLALRLEHPNIVHAYELSREEGSLFLAMEYLHGQSLARLRQRSREREERLAPELVAWIGARAADALAYAHSLVDDAGNPLSALHRDVSPDTIFLTYDGRVVLIDFCSAKAAGRVAETRDHRADLFALGATLYEAAVGKSPLPAAEGSEAGESAEDAAVPPPSSVLPGFPEELSGILLRALERDPVLRPSSAAELSHDLDHFAGQNASASSLSELLVVHFEEERAAQDAAIDELFAAPALVRSLPPGLTTTAAPTAASVRPVPHEKPSRWGLVALACALFMAVGAVASIFATRHSVKGGDGSRAAAGPGAPRAPVPPDPRATAGNNAAPAISASPPADGGGPRFVP